MDDPNFAYMLDGGFFAFRPGLDGLEPVEVAAPSSGVMAAADLSPMSGTLPEVGADAVRTVR